MQEVRRIAACSFFMTMAGCLSFWSIACTAAAKGDDSFITKIQTADQIVLATSDVLVNVPGGESFQMKIDKVLRGKSKPGTLLRIVQSGDAKTHPKFEAKQQYLLFLKKAEDPTKGWLYSGLDTLPINDGKLLVIVDEEKPEEVTIPDLVKLIAENMPATETVPERKNLTGRWYVVISQNGSDVWLWLVEIGAIPANGGAPEVKQIAATQGLPASTLASSKITGDAVELTFKTEGQTFHFDGTFAKGVVKGSVSASESGLIPARLIATESGSLDGFKDPRESLGSADFVEAMKKEKPEALREFIAKFPESPLALDAYTAVAAMLAATKAPTADYEKMAEDYQKAASAWGPALQTRVYLDLGVNLLRRKHLSELGLKYLDAGEKKFTEATPKFLKSVIRKERGRGLLATGKTEEGAALLEKIHGESPFDAEVTYLLASQAEAAKKPDEAIGMYAELAALPSLEPQLAQLFRSRGEKDLKELLPSTKLKTLWEAKNGNTSGLEKYLNEVAEERLRKLAKGTVPPRKPGEGTRVALLELFTGGSCPPCIGADAAITALEATYQQSELIVLRYHQHIPRPDPLATVAGTKRMELYQAQGTPAIFLNGKPYQLGGGLETAPMIYEALRAEIDPFLTEKIQPKVVMTAKAVPGAVEVTATATGLKEFPKTLRLLLVVAESRVEFLSDNGIRVHEMVVRSIPTTAGGIAPVNGQYELKFPLKTGPLRNVLSQHLADVEKETEQPFRSKPLELKNLKLVGFLQSEETGAISQAAIISLPAELPGAAAPTTPAPAKVQPGKIQPGKVVPGKPVPRKVAPAK